MRLLNTRTIELVEFTPDCIPEYAILSHTWEQGEVLFADLQHRTEKTKPAWPKVQSACAQAWADGFGWIWIDTCCIDKSSSAELSEAINSMFTSYASAAVCYAYLSDVRVWLGHEGVEELLAPFEVVFFSRDRVRFGERSSMARILSHVTQINYKILTHTLPLNSMSIAQRMSWVARRQTTRPEDMAYCLMGIFSVNMPILYGEGGERAFLRLQEEIMKYSEGQTIFAWTDKSAHPSDRYGLLAPSPACFADSQDIIAWKQEMDSSPYAMTNRGLRIDLQLAGASHESQDLSPGLMQAILHCGGVSKEAKYYDTLALYLKPLSKFGNRYVRVDIGSLVEAKIRGLLACGPVQT